MRITATYICPVRGLSRLEAPDTVRLAQATKVAKDLGIGHLLFPILEESLVGSARIKVQFLDGLIQALDRVLEGGLSALLIAPAQKVLGLDWVPPHLVRGIQDPKAARVFLEGKIRGVYPFDWWSDPSYVQKRIKLFREIVVAVQGHPAVIGWVIMDRGLEWARPKLYVADLVLKSYVAEIRERDERESIYMGIGWRELLDPGMVRALSRQVDGLRMSGLENHPRGMDGAPGLAGELQAAAYLGTLAQWLFGQPVEVEVGWNGLGMADDPEEILSSLKRLALHGLAGMNWLNLIDPEPRLHSYPPWVLRSGLGRLGILDEGLEPKEHVATWLNAIGSISQKDGVDDFIDINVEEYLADPQIHLLRLWDHFR